jgi:hypothetical protein
MYERYDKLMHENTSENKVLQKPKYEQRWVYITSKYFLGCGVSSAPETWKDYSNSLCAPVVGLASSEDAGVG